MLLLVYLAMACTLRYECDPVESGIAGSHVTVLDCQLRGAIVCGPRRLTKTWNRLVPVAARAGMKLEEASEQFADVTEPATSRIISGTLLHS